MAQDTPEQSKALSNAQIIRAALIVLFGFLASGVLGFVRTAVLSAQFGTSEAYDAFLAAQRLPEIIFVLVAGGALGSSFIPIYAKYREIDQDKQAWRLASAVMTLSAAAAGILALIIMLTAPALVSHVLFVGRSPEAQALTTELVRIMIITPFIFAISGLVMGILQSHGLFLLPSVAISMNSIGIMIGALVFAPLLATMPYTAVDVVNAASLNGYFADWIWPVSQVGVNSVYGLALGAVLSALLHLGVQIPGLVRIRARLRVSFNISIPGVWQVLRLMGPRVLGLAVVQINFVVNIFLASQMQEGSLVALQTAFNLMFFALGIIAQSVGSAVFPTLAALYAERDMTGFKDRLSNAMRSVLFLSFPAMMAFIVYGEPIVSIFERGNWTAESTQATAWALAFYGVGIAGFALLEVLSRAFYALEDTWTPVIVGVGAMVGNIVLSFIFVQFIGIEGDITRGPFAGLALANALTTLIEAVVLWVWMRRRVNQLDSTSNATQITGINDGYILSGAWRALVAALLMGFILHLMLNLEVSGILKLMLGGAIGGLVFFGTGWLLKLPEAKAIPNLILRRIRR